MNALRMLVAACIRWSAVGILLLVLLFPAYKNLLIVYGPLLLSLGVAVYVNRRLESGWTPAAAWDRRVFFAVLLAGPALVQVLLLVGLRPEPMYDGRFVFREAVLLAETGRMSPLTYYPPAQTWWYAAWFKIFGASPLVAQLSHVPLHALVSLLTYGFARRVTPGLARLAALVVAWYPSFVGYVLTTPYYHYLYTASVVATAWAWVVATDRPRGALAAGLASGLGALTKATQLIAPAQALAFWLLDAGPIQRASRIAHPVSRIALFLVGMAVVIGPWTYRNWLVFDDLVPVCTSGGLVLHSANNPESNGLYSGVPDLASIHTPADMLAHSRASAETAKRFMREEPARFARLAVGKVLHTWGGEATFAELINHRGRPLGHWEDGFSGVFYLGWVCVVGVWAGRSLVALRTRRPLHPAELALGVVLFSNAAVYAVFEGGDRHHLPIVPLIVVAALAGAAAPAKACEPDGSRS